ncbi:MotA/TolQ/ExbB proton channel family protein [Longimicrobium sp.]|uniref:MotA/TolQ/ExbB proton channel family protein n=1 Tax=Longimicrobium sp. TaxID=2029185 RepID=UPI002E37CF7D|nr:MotA/TolQ/ExbB proton channel family protein [Longimicrobium sp.]HEX6042477.1 MotA/TolQ/ExbB proton channel family protein [Longimicrobium sp.]
MNEHGILYMIWRGNTGVGWVITLLLLALGAAAAWVALRHARRYHVEERSALGSVRAALEEVHTRERPATGPANPSGKAGDPPGSRPLLVSLDTLRKRAPATSIIGERLTELARMKQARVRVTVDALQQLTMMRENSRPGLAFPGYAVDLCTMIGMLGTFIGLCMMLMRMDGVASGGVTSATGFAEAANSLGAIIASKKTAFVTTLVGLSCAIIVSMLNFLLARAQSRFYDELERFTAAELLPATVPAEEDETMMEKLSLQFAESFEKLSDIARLQERNGDLQNGILEAFTRTVESIRSLALDAAARGPDAEAGGALAALVKQVADSNAALAGRMEEAFRTRHRPQEWQPSRSGGWGALGGQLGGLLSDFVGQLRQNPALAVGGVGAAVVLAVIIW